MSDVECPYCENDNEINHDDGYGYQEGEEYEQKCVSCGKKFKYSTSILYCYDVYCYNNSEHDLEEPLEGVR